MPRFRVELCQSLKHSLRHPHIGLSGKDGRIQRLRLWAVEDGDVCRRLMTDTARKTNQNRDAKSKTRPRKNPLGALGNGHRVISIASAQPGHWLAQTGAMTAKCWLTQSPAGQRAASSAGARKSAFAFVVFVELVFQIPMRCLVYAPGLANSRAPGPGRRKLWSRL